MIMENDNEIMLTTIDNPFNPFTQYDEWLAFDEEKGYYTNNYLARIANTSFELSESEENEEIDNAINEIVRLDPFLMYRKVKRSDYDSQNRLKMAI